MAEPEAFRYEAGALRCEALPVAAVAERVGTPVYIYSKTELVRRFDTLRGAFAEAAPLVCFSVKANGNLAVLRLLARRGAGFDVVSGGELHRARLAGAAPERIVYAGVGKTDDELRYALAEGIHLFDVESAPELARLSALAAERGRRARVALRLNPDVDPRTHSYTATGLKETKFGLDPAAARALFAARRDYPGADLVGLHVHIGSQITHTAPYREAMARLLAFAESLGDLGVRIAEVNLGGGFGIDYEGGGGVPPLGRFAAEIAPPVRARGWRLVLEPGRWIAGPSGILLARVTYVKRTGAGKRFVILDTGMHQLLRPALYGAYHRIWPVRAAAGPGEAGAPACADACDVVGPICETGDFLAKDRPLPEVAAGDLVAVFSAGAYGASMASQYNAHPRPPEVLVDGAGFTVVRRRETYADLVAAELEPAGSE